MKTCPICSKRLVVFYSLNAGLCRCLCDNPDCILWQKNVVGEGDRTEEAMDHFIGLSLRWQKPTGKAA